ncbi:MAG: hypothetical protein M3Y76_12235, partial [Chloroflexota bacterium]|nr:hypothetical protein [Chloroflexota bacterium]
IAPGEEIFLKTYGDIPMRDFVIRQRPAQIVIENHQHDIESVRTHYERSMKYYKGHYKVNFFPLGDQRGDDFQRFEVLRYSEIIWVITKPKGESRSWLEIGTTKEYRDNLGYTYRKWISDSLRYLHMDSRLGVVRDYFQSIYVKWHIAVASDYPLEIRVISRGPILKNVLLKPSAYVDTTERALWKPQ